MLLRYLYFYITLVEMRYFGGSSLITLEGKLGGLSATNPL